MSHFLVGKVKRNGTVVKEFKNVVFETERERVVRLIASGDIPSTNWARIAVDNRYVDEANIDVNAKYLYELDSFQIDTAPNVNQAKMSRKSEFTFPIQANPSQVSHPITRAFAINMQGAPSQTVFAAADFETNAFGRVFSHAAGSDWIGSDPNPATGDGEVTLDGTFNGEGHYIYSIRIVSGGDETNSEYVLLRYPWYRGAAYPGSTNSDSFTSGEGLNSLLSGERCYQQFDRRFDTIASPNPPEVPYGTDYPDSGFNVTNPACVYIDREYWILNTTRSATFDDSENELFTLLKLSDQQVKRRQITNLTYTGVEFRDIAKGRDDRIYLAADSDQDDGTGPGPGNGFLVVIDPTTDVATNVLTSEDCLAVAVDTSESYAAAGFDRVWVLHRDGLTYFDVEVSTSAIGSATKIDSVTLGDSARGLAGHDVPGMSKNSCAPLLEVLNGRPYWISRTTAGSSTSIHRLNRMDGDGTNFGFYTSEPTGEVGAIDSIVLGSAGSNNMFNALRVFQPDDADPDLGDIWVSARTDANAQDGVIHIPEDDWGSLNPGTRYTRGTDYASNAATINFQISPDGQVWLLGNNSTWSLLKNDLSSFHVATSTFGSNDTVPESGMDWYADGTGLMLLPPASDFEECGHLFSTPVCYQWSSSQSAWYRRRIESNATASGRVVGSSQSLVDGASVTFGAGSYVLDERYTFLGSKYLTKDTDEEITVEWEIFASESDIVSNLAVVPATGTAEVWATTSTSPGTVDPLASQPNQDLRIAAAVYQKTVVQANFTGADTVYGLDLKADFNTSKLYFQTNANTTFFLSNPSFELWSATDADGMTSATLRSTWSKASFKPEWRFTSGANGTSSQATGPFGITIDLDALEANSAFEGGDATNTAQRYWKLYVSNVSSSKQFYCFCGILANGSPINTGPMLTNHNDPDWESVSVQRITTEIDSGAGMSVSGINYTVSDTTGYQHGDIVESGGNEAIIDQVLNSTDFTVLYPIIPDGTGLSYTIRRAVTLLDNAYPTVADEVFVDPLTGAVVFSDADITAGTNKYFKYAWIRRG